MNFDLSPEQQAIAKAVAELCTRFPESYWRERDRDGGHQRPQLGARGVRGGQLSSRGRHGSGYGHRGAA
ncbi:MAG: acyl-CoA dehydrogenase, partial [Burkholderiaceae bacterium]|nr:acyl-CoA dehydrogenase [Burkholderiaceae bacterium]